MTGKNSKNNKNNTFVSVEELMKNGTNKGVYIVDEFRKTNRTKTATEIIFREK